MDESNYTKKSRIPNRLWASLSMVSNAIISDLEGVSLLPEHKRNINVVKEEYLGRMIRGLKTLRENVKKRKFSFDYRLVEGLNNSYYLTPLLMDSELSNIDLIFHTVKRLDNLIESFNQGKLSNIEKIYLSNLIDLWAEG